MKITTVADLLCLAALLGGAAAFTPSAARGWVRTAPARCSTRGAVRMEVKDALSQAEEKMKKSVANTQENLNTLRTGRASPAMLDRINVDYYETPTPLNQLAGVTVSSGTSLVVDPYDKSILGDIERALMESDLGLTPSNNGETIRLNIPSLTEERRKEILKTAKSLGEEGKVAIRNIRRDAVDRVKKLEKSDDISEDQSKDGQDAVQKLTDKYTKSVDDIVKDKEKELMTV